MVTRRLHVPGQSIVPWAALAQLVEHRIRNAEVGCSSHPGGTITLKLGASLFKFLFCLPRGLAIWREGYLKGHSILIYQHFTREKRNAFVARIGDGLAELTACPEIWCFRSPHVAFFLLIHPHQMPTLAENAANISRNWGEEFLVGNPLTKA